MMAYLLDANIFIQAKNLHYGFDFCPAFWDWLDRENSRGTVFSIEKVGDELEAGNDELAAWALARKTTLFLQPDEKVFAAFANVSAWANGHGYDAAAVSTFLQRADYYLVSQAKAHDHIVVTHEVPSPSVLKVKIPNACIGVGVKCVTPYEMLRIVGARFILRP